MWDVDLCDGGEDLCDGGELETISASTDCVWGRGDWMRFGGESISFGGESIIFGGLLLASSAVSSLSADDIEDEDDDGVLFFDWITVTDVFVSSSSSGRSGG